MTVRRGVVLLILFTGLALSVVYLRTEQVRAAARTMNLELRQIEARRELWQLEASVARLRSPEQIRTRLPVFVDDLHAPDSALQKTHGLAQLSAAPQD